jgi:hypothetical protein
LWNGTLLENRADRALGNTQRAVDAVIRLDDREAGSLTKDFRGTDVDAVRVFAHDAAFGHNDCHRIHIVAA